MFVVIEHTTSARTLANGREERHAWPPRVTGRPHASADAATAAARADRARDPEGSFEVCEIVTTLGSGVALVRPVVRLLGGFGRGAAYEAEYWG